MMVAEEERWEVKSRSPLAVGMVGGVRYTPVKRRKDCEMEATKAQEPS